MVKSSFSIVAILLLLLIVVGLIRGIILWATSGKASANGEMSCGGCGYAVRGLEALNCPECGADLRKVGINREQSSGRRGLGVALTICCGGLLLLSAGMLAFLFLDTGTSSSHPANIQQSMPQSLQSIPAVPNPGTSGPTGTDISAPNDPPELINEPTDESTTDQSL